MKRDLRHLARLWALVAGLASGTSFAQSTGFKQSGVGPFDYNDSAHWVGGNINGLWDATLDIPATQTVTFAADTILTTGLSFLYTNSGNLTLRGTTGTVTLTLGGDIVHNTGSGTRTITLGSTTASQTLNLDLGGMTRQITVGSGRTLGFINTISNGGISASGGTLNFSAANTYSGPTIINSGIFSLNGLVGSAANSDFTVRANSASNPTLVFSGSSGIGFNRAKSVTFNGAGDSNGALLNVTGNSSSNTVETITNAITAQAGHAQVTITPNAATNTRLAVDSLVRRAGATILFRGANLGSQQIETPTAGVANLQFTNAPTLTGGSGLSGSTTMSIIKGAYGDASSSGNGFSATGGLVTYEASHGVRLLSANEYAPTITDGQTTLNNVRLANSSGTAATTVLTTNTTVNSLSLSATGATSPISVDGAGTLKISSGVIHASSLSPATNGSEMTINNPVDLNGGEGVVLFSTAGSSNGTGGAMLVIKGALTNDGGNGVTFRSAAGVVEFSGSSSNTYTGVTTINGGGSVRLNKSGGATAIPGNIVINAGVLQSTGNQIADTADITLFGGTFTLRGGALNSGTGASETFRDLTMSGGSFSDGAGGTSSGTTTLRNASLTGGNWSVSNGHKSNLSGTLSLGGGTISITRANDTTRTTVVTVASNFSIQNTATGAYTPITLNGGTATGIAGGRLVLNGTASFTGNATNANPTRIAVTAPSNGGGDSTISLNGPVTFEIGDGAALTDLAIAADVANNGATAGSLTKSGLGTLELGGNNTYTGPTQVNAGTLLLSGALTATASLQVNAGATLATDASASIATGMGGDLSISGILSPGGSGGYGILTVNPGTAGKLSFLTGSTFQLDLQPTPASSDAVSFAMAGDWISGSGLATLSLGGTIDYGATYTVFENVTTTDFAFAGITGYDMLNYSAAVTQAGDDYQLTFTAIPEPSTVISLLGGLGLLACARRPRGRNDQGANQA